MTQTTYLSVTTISLDASIVYAIEHNYPTGAEAIKALRNAMRSRMLLDTGVLWETFWLEVPDFLTSNKLAVPGIHRIKTLPTHQIDNGDLGFTTWEDVEAWLMQDLAPETRRELLRRLPATELKEWVEDLTGDCGDWSAITGQDEGDTTTPAAQHIERAVAWLEKEMQRIYTR